MTTNEMREEFEAEFPVPAGVYWHDEAQRYASSCREALYKAESHRAMWKAWQAATRRALPDGFVPVPVDVVKDAERYKWLRDGGNESIGVIRGADAMDYGSSGVIGTFEDWLDSYYLDHAIDAAMLQAAPRGSE